MILVPRLSLRLGKTALAAATAVAALGVASTASAQYPGFWQSRDSYYSDGYYYRSPPSRVYYYDPPARSYYYDPPPRTYYDAPARTYYDPGTGTYYRTSPTYYRENLGVRIGPLFLGF